MIKISKQVDVEINETVWTEVDIDQEDIEEYFENCNPLELVHFKQYLSVNDYSPKSLHEQYYYEITQQLLKNGYSPFIIEERLKDLL